MNPNQILEITGELNTPTPQCFTVALAFHGKSFRMRPGWMRSKRPVT